MKYKIVFPIMMLAAIPLFAQQNDETDWLSQISRNNKELQSARQAMEGDILMAKSENNLADPEFEMEYGFQRPENGLELVVSESFEWPGMYVARKKHIDSRITAMEYVYQSKALSLLVEAKQLLIELVNINKRIVLQEKIMDMVRLVVAMMPITAIRMTTILTTPNVAKRKVITKLLVCQAKQPKTSAFMTATISKNASAPMVTKFVPRPIMA